MPESLILERLASLETKITLLVQSMDKQHEYDKESMKMMKDNIDKLNYIVIGNGEIGLVGKVDGLMKIKSHIVALWLVTVGAVIKVIVDQWTKHVT